MTSLPCDWGIERVFNRTRLENILERLIRVDLHLHSNLSDGAHSLKKLADMLARRKVEVASLTDHDSIDGLHEFKKLLNEKGIGFITGVELTTQTIWGEVHLLGYGFDLDSNNLKEFLNTNKISRETESVASVEAVPRKKIAKSRPKRNISEQQLSSRQLNLNKNIKAIHENGGKVFLAHPLTISKRWEYVEKAVEEFAEAGLDGIEALYGNYTLEEQQKLLDLAERLGLYVIAGSDYHNPEDSGKLGKDIPQYIWKDFRSAVTSELLIEKSDSSEKEPNQKKERIRMHWGNFIARIILPTFVSFLLFIITLFFMIIPNFENILMERKKELIRELTNSAVSILSQYHNSAVGGKISKVEAKKLAKFHIQNLRYGKENKDYFWIIDTHPNMIVHPYRMELNNTDVSDYKDSNGAKVFVEFVKAVKENDAGYVEYLWQWKDNESRIVPKLSYVKKFLPWDWIIGTGIYIEDVEEEISDVTENLINFIIIIAILSGLFLFYIAQQTFRIERSRSVVELALRDSHEKYRFLVEASTEGTMILTNGRCRYSNKTMQDMLLYSEEEFYLLDATDIIKNSGNEEFGIADIANELMNNRLIPAPVEVELLMQSGEPFTAILVTSRITFDDQEGLIITIRGVAGEAKGERVGSLEKLETLNQKSLIDELQHSIQFFTQRVEEIMTSPITCDIETPVKSLVEIMKLEGDSAVIVLSDSGKPLGIITDRDLRERVLHEGFYGSVYEIMSSPLVTISHNGLMYEALAKMKEYDVDYLAVKNHKDGICGIISDRELLETLYFSYSNFYWQIQSCTSPEAIVAIVYKMKDLITPLIMGSGQPGTVSRILAGVMDRITAKLMDFAMKELGPPPTGFAFMAIGSHGREELTLASDQDNAIVYSDVGRNDESVARYFQRLGKMINDWLANAGYALCNGDMMAGNPKWCKPLSEWKKFFLNWIKEPDSQELLDFNIFFDFRCIFGDNELTNELRSYINSELKNNPLFFIQAAQNSLNYKSPIGPFGNLVTTSTEGGERVLQIKNAMIQLVNFARIYALENSLICINTIERLNNLFVDGVIQKAVYEEAIQAYNYLMTIRLRSQLHRGEKPDRRGVKMSELTSLERSMLKQVFSHLNLLNKTISTHFIGAG